MSGEALSLLTQPMPRWLREWRRPPARHIRLLLQRCASDPRRSVMRRARHLCALRAWRGRR